MSRGRATALEDEYGLSLRRVAQRLEETPSVAQTFDVGGDNVGIGVARKMIEEVGLVEVEGVAVADDLAEAKAAAPTPAGDAEGVAAALTEEADIAGFVGDVGVEGDALLRIVQAHAVRPYDPNPRLARATAQLLLRLDAVGAARLAETGREEVDELRSLCFRAFYQVERGAGGNGGDDEVDRPGYVLQTRVRLQAE